MATAAFRTIGKRYPREDGPQLASGSALYVEDLQRRGLLFGAVVRAGRPHARILRVDVGGAARAKGVACVLTAADVPHNAYGPFIADQPLLCADKVRYEGDPVVALCAESWEAAGEAAAKVRVEYEDLPAVTDPEEALRPGSPLVHESHPTGNLVVEYKLRRGDVEAAFAAADLIVEERYCSRPQEHASMETHICMAEVEPAGKLTVYVSTQRPFAMRAALSRVLGLPISRVRVLFDKVGGGFGGKHEPMLEPLAALCALRTGRPMKFRMTREEEFTASTVRHSFVMDYKTGVTREGKIIAQENRFVLDGGAYCCNGHNVAGKAAILGTGPYRVENLKAEALLVYTNNGIAGACRGFGITQTTYGSESHMDTIARRLNMDPLEFRRRNAMQAGDRDHSGSLIASCGYLEALEAASRAAGWESIGGGQPSPCGTRRRGRGVAGLLYPVGPIAVGTPSGAFARVNEDATLTVWTGVIDVGQGAHVILRQIAAEELGVEVEKVHLVAGDTDATPLDTSSTGSRVTHIAGNAVRLVVGKVKAQLLRKAAEMLEAAEGDLRAEGGAVFVVGAPDRRLSLAEVARKSHREGELIVAGGAHVPPGLHVDESTGQGKPFECYVFAAQCAEVEVDVETGECRILQLTAAHDVGRAINPMNVEGQIEGALLMGYGLAAMERILMKDGRALNPNLTDYLIPTALDVPESIRSIIVEAEEPTGPFGAKGVGEPALNPTAPAILNAIYDAVGVRLRDLPATPEAILRAMGKLRGDGSPPGRRPGRMSSVPSPGTGSRGLPW